MKMRNEIYDVLVWIAQVLVPAVATFYVAVAAIWGLPAAEQVAGTLAAVDTLMGALLKISSIKYNSGK